MAPALIRALDDITKPVRIQSAVALGNYGSEARAALPALNELLVRNDAGMRKAVAESIGNTDNNLCTHSATRGGKEMKDIDRFIELIRDSRNQDALDMLNASPFLATAHSDREGQLHGASPLHWAAHRNAIELCERLIDLGADVNDSASDWWLTPLAWGADAGSAEAVELLIKRGAQVDQDAVVGTTALHAAAMGGSSQGGRDPQAYQRTAEILIAYGANVNGRSDRKESPLDDAIKYKNEHVAAVLRKHGAEVSKPSE